MEGVCGDWGRVEARGGAKKEVCGAVRLARGKMAEIGGGAKCESGAERSRRIRLDRSLWRGKGGILGGMGRFEAELRVERVEGGAGVGVVVFVGVETTCMARET